ncbi:uncharacterized protein L199_007252 [Kwoniella botswanensis]|uniref:uncharacterized protein n=1 Tax=Kwoniella botswanensis TaxID=1268659 RepID=UPI00315DF2B4
MPLPTSGSIPLIPPTSEHPPHPAYLIKFPEEVWQTLQEAGSGGLEVIVTEDGKMILSIPNLPPIPLDPRSTGIPSELHSYNPSSSTLSLAAMASTRLNVPLTSASTARAADKLKAQNEAIERERKERAIRVEGSAPPSKKRTAAGVAAAAPGVSSAGMGRTNSSPQMGSSTSAPTQGASTTGTGTGTGQMIPLKTRVMQLLALGPTTVQDIVRRVGGDEQNVMRVVNVVGRASSTHPPTYTLLPNQYSKIKLGPGQWKYTYAEQQQVIRLAREAFDELELPFDAEEREELDRKEAGLENGGGYHSASAESSNGSQSQVKEKPLPTVPQNGLSIAPPSRNESPAPSASGTTNKTRSTRKSTNGGGGTGGTTAAGPQSRIARERAKFMAEKQRSTSLTNTKPPDGTASPGLTPADVKPAKDNNKTKIEDKKEEKEKVHGSSKNKGKGKEVDYSSSSEEDDFEEPLRGRLAAKSNGKEKERRDGLHDQGKSKDRLSLAEKVREKDKAREREREKERQEQKERLTPNHKKRSYSSSPDAGGEEEEEGEIRGRPIIKTRRNSSPTSKRKSPPPELKLNGANTDTSTKSGPSRSTAVSKDNHPVSAPLPNTNKKTNGINQLDRPDQEALRDRYEELYPAYQQLTKKLSRIHQAAESGMKVNNENEDDNGITDENELNKLVGKWQKWHNELEGIRRWFV